MESRTVTARRIAYTDAAHSGEVGGAGSVMEFRDWSSLTELMLLLVLRRLDSLEDFFSFRGVCRSWRSLASPSPSTTSSMSPLLLISRFPSQSRALLDISRRRLYSFSLPWTTETRKTLDYSHGHIISTTNHRRPKPLLWKLFTGSFTHLPRAIEPFRRGILSARLESLDCIIVLFNYVLIQFLRHGDRLWTLLPCDLQSQPPAIIIDALFIKGRLFVLTGRGQLALAELSPSPELVLLQPGDDAASELDMTKPSRWLLADCGGDLLALSIVINMHGECVLSILRWEFENGGGWSKVSSLGGRALFMNYRGFAASIVPSCSAVRGDCVYFLPGWRSQWSVYSLLDGSLEVFGAYAAGICVGPPDFLPSEVPIWVIPSSC